MKIRNQFIWKGTDIYAHFGSIILIFQNQGKQLKYSYSKFSQKDVRKIVKKSMKSPCHQRIRTTHTSILHNIQFSEMQLHARIFVKLLHFKTHSNVKIRNSTQSWVIHFQYIKKPFRRYLYFFLFHYFQSHILRHFFNLLRNSSRRILDFLTDLQSSINVQTFQLLFQCKKKIVL